MSNWDDCSGDPIADINEMVDRMRAQALEPNQPTMRIHSPREFQVWKESGLYGSIAQEEALKEKLGSMDKMYEKATPEQILNAFIAIPYLLFTQFPYFAGLWAIENDLTEGFLLHLSTVAFVETLEFFGVLMFYRFTLKKNGL